VLQFADAPDGRKPRSKRKREIRAIRAIGTPRSADRPLSNSRLRAIRAQLLCNISQISSRGREGRPRNVRSFDFPSRFHRGIRYDVPSFPYTRTRNRARDKRSHFLRRAVRTPDEGYLFRFSFAGEGRPRASSIFSRISQCPPKRTLGTGAEEPLQLCVSARSIKISFYPSRSMRGFPSPGGAIRSIDRSCPAIAGARGGRTCPRMCLTLASHCPVPLALTLTPARVHARCHERGVQRALTHSHSDAAPSRVSEQWH